MPAKIVYERFLWFHNCVKAENYSHCSLRNELGDFALSWICSVKPSLEGMSPKFSSDAIKKYIRRNFGLLSRDTWIEVCLRFSLQIVPRVSEQVWHSEQIQAVQSDESLCLMFTVADLREIKGDVLKYRSQVEFL